MTDIFNRTQTGEAVTYTLRGRLDTSTAPRLQDVLIGEFNTAKKVLLDCAGLAYISSAGLRVLLLGEKTAKAKGCTMTLSGVSQDVMDVFEMTGFADILNIV